MITARMIGWALWGVSFFFMLRTARLDRTLVQFRAPGTPPGAYVREFGRWRRAQYTAEGQAVISQTRMAFALFFIFFLLGVLVFESYPAVATPG